VKFDSRSKTNLINNIKLVISEMPKLELSANVSVNLNQNEKKKDSRPSLPGVQVKHFPLDFKCQILIFKANLNFLEGPKYLSHVIK